MHFFVAWLLSIVVITETYVRHVRNLRTMNRLIHSFICIRQQRSIV